MAPAQPRLRVLSVVSSPEEAASDRGPAFDYVILCVKALPDVYNLADIIQSVVTPQHTCIIVNTTNTLGVEKQLESRFPTNVVLSLVSGAAITQIGASEFEHTGSREVWVGPANLDAKIPHSIQRDMSEALAMTLTTGQVDCKVSDNIRQQQYERMIGPIAFHPISVIFETSNLSELINKPGVRDLVSDVIEELIHLASSNKCMLPATFKQRTIESMSQSSQEQSTMYQDFTARRPMEVETYLGAPTELAKEAGIAVPRIETLYTILRHINATNKDRPAQATQQVHPPPASENQTPVPQPARMAHNPPPPRPMNGNPGPMNSGPHMRPNGMRMGPPPARRGPPPVNGYRGIPPNGYPPRGPSQLGRRPSFDENNMDEFQHVVLYDDVPDGDVAAAYGEPGNAMAMRERELMLREKELRMREHEISMRSRNGSRKPHQSKHQAYMDDDDDDDDAFDPMDNRMAHAPVLDADNIDMMSVTSRRTKRAPSQSQLRRGMFEGGAPMRGGSQRPHNGRHRTSAQLMSDMPVLGGNILDNPMTGFSSNRYGAVDRKEMADESRANSLTASRLHEMGGAGGPYPQSSRRTSRSPGNPLSPMGPGPMAPMGRPHGRPSPPNDTYMQGPPRNGRPSPPGGMQAPVPRYPVGPGNLMHEQQAGVSKPYPPKPTKSLTGSASASANSGDSGSANIESDPSAHSSTSSFAPRAMMGVH
ncbi:hypothetical protein LTS08_006131 [Lithohypha guttulata]|nr:hypothetical protein LTS08_006131 [Lithohypha guttulata]